MTVQQVCCICGGGTKQSLPNSKESKHKNIYGKEHKLILEGKILVNPNIGKVTTVDGEETVMLRGEEGEMELI